MPMLYELFPLSNFDFHVTLRNQTTTGIPMRRDGNAKCDGCSHPGRWLLHNIRQRATFRRFCTNCVLKNHPGFFCPFCLEVFNEFQPPPPSQRLVCHRCPSVSHLSCAPNSSTYTFVCPSCSDPDHVFFEIQSDSDQNRSIDKDAARALLAAAKIAAVSMGRAASIARAEAEKRVREAAVAKRRAKEALERVALLAAKMNPDKAAVISKAIIGGDGDPASKRNILSGNVGKLQPH